MTAIAEHQRQTDTIRALQSHYNTAAAENEMLRRELQGLRMESAQLRGELHSSSSHPPPPPAPAPAQQQQQPPQAPYAADPYANSTRPELPPIRSIGNNMSNGPESMTGVQYETPRANGFRQERY